MIENNPDCLSGSSFPVRKAIPELCDKISWKAQPELAQHLATSSSCELFREPVIKNTVSTSKRPHLELDLIRKPTPSGSSTGLSFKPSLCPSSAPLSTPTSGMAIKPDHIDLGTSEPSPFRVDHDSHFRGIQVDAVNLMVDVLRGGPIPVSRRLTFASPSTDSGLHHPCLVKLSPLGLGPPCQSSCCTPCRFVPTRV